MCDNDFPLCTSVGRMCFILCCTSKQWGEKWVTWSLHMNLSDRKNVRQTQRTLWHARITCVLCVVKQVGTTPVPQSHPPVKNQWTRIFVSCDRQKHKSDSEKDWESAISSAVKNLQVSKRTLSQSSFDQKYAKKGGRTHEHENTKCTGMPKKFTSRGYYTALHYTTLDWIADVYLPIGAAK